MISSISKTWTNLSLSLVHAVKCDNPWLLLLFSKLEVSIYMPVRHLETLQLFEASIQRVFTRRVFKEFSQGEYSKFSQGQKKTFNFKQTKDNLSSNVSNKGQVCGFGKSYTCRPYIGKGVKHVVFFSANVMKFENIILKRQDFLNKAPLYHLAD